MKRKHLLSAVLALLMVISMVTVIALPTGAEVDLSKIPSVTTATGSNSKAQEFKISTVEELIYASKFPTYFGAGDVLYLANDLDCNDYGSSFGADFKNFNPAQDGRTEMRCTFDGLGHTIYNYLDNFPFFGGRQVDVIRNLNFSNAAVINLNPSIYAYCILMRSVEFDMLIENCHIDNSYVYSAYPMYNAMFVALINNNPGKNLTMINCTVTNSDLNVDGGASASGLFVGRFGATAKLTIENCMAVNSTLSGSVNASTSQGSGFVIGEVYNNSWDERVAINNVGVFDCAYEYPNATAAATAAIAVTKKGSNNQTLNYNNVYAAGNVLSTDPNSSEDDVPLDRIFLHLGGDTGYTCGTAYGGPDVEYALFSKDGIVPSVTIPEENIDPTFSMGAAMLLMNKIEAAENSLAAYKDWGIDTENRPMTLTDGKGVPMKMTFNEADGNVKAFYTNVEGGLVADGVDFQLLRKVSWTDNKNVEYPAKDIHWDRLKFTAPTTFTEHEVEVVSNGDGTHSTYCHTSDGCVDTLENIPCRGFAVGTEESGFYGEDATVYECTVCGYRWKDYISDAVSPAPLMMNYEAEGYDVDSMATLTVSRAATTSLAGFAFLVDYDAALIEFDNFELLDNRYICKIVPIDIGILSVVMVQKDGVALNNADDILKLNFRTVDALKDDAEAPATMTVTQAVTKVSSGTAAENVSVIQNMLDTNAMIYAAFTAGDVNADGAVDLLDAILMMEKLNGVIDAADDEDFVARAANVDGDDLNEVNTADITYMLRYLANWSANAQLNRSEPQPTLVA